MPPPSPVRLHARPALVGAALVAGGVALEAALGLGVAGWLAVLAGAGALLLAGALQGRRIVTLRPLLVGAAALLAALSLGGTRMAAWERPPPDDVAHAAAAADRLAEAGGDATLVLTGRVVTPPEPRPTGVRFRLEAEQARRGARQQRVSGRVEVTLAYPRNPRTPRPRYPALDLGDRVRVTGAPAAPPDRRNPADLDYGRYLRRQGVGATLRVQEAAAVRVVAPPGRVAGAVAAVRRHVREAFSRYVRDRDARAALVALVLADRSGIDDATRAAFAETGLTHLLAVSGLHILLVGMVLYRLLRPVLTRLGLGWGAVEATRAAVTLLVLVLYAAVTGGAPSAVRAVVMAAVFVVGRGFQQPTDALNGLGLAALGLLAWRPTVLYDVGFQLSFAAVIALVLLVPVLTGGLPERWMRRRWVRASVRAGATSLAATLGTAPLLLYHFGRLPLAGLALNLGAIPASEVALGAGLGVALTGGWWPWAADGLAAVAEGGARAMLWISRAGAEGLDGAAVVGFVRAPAWLLAMGCLLFLPVVWRVPWRRWRVTAGALGCAAVGAWAAVAAAPPPHLDAVALDVGQGDAVLLRLPGGHHVLIDAGPRDTTWDAGARTVVPHLRRYGVRRLDAVVLTHPHADHVGGLEAVLRAVPVGRVVINGQPSTLAWLARARRAADSLGVPWRTARAGDTLALDPAVRLRVLAPAAAPPDTDDSDATNDGSLVLRVEFGRTALLFTGDAEGPAEAALVARYGAALAADVVKVGHHGSRTSSSDAFVRAAARRSATGSAPWAVVSVGRRNLYGLPDEEPLARWAAAGARVRLTSRDGAVWLRSDGARVREVDWRSREE